MKAKFKVFLVAAFAASIGAYEFVSKYENFRKSVPLLIQDGGEIYKCRIRGDEVACKARLQTDHLSLYLYKVVDGDTLSEVVVNKWKFRADEAHQVMQTVLANNPQAFVNRDINKLRAGATLTVPTAEMRRGISGRRGT